MIDHIGVLVSDFERSKHFYAAALAPIGYALVREVPASVTGHTDIAGFGADGVADVWLSKGTPNVPPVHIALRVKDRAQVDAFHRAAVAAGGKDNGKPGLRPQYHAGYYGAFVLDPDGHNIEAVHHDQQA